MSDDIKLSVGDVAMYSGDWGKEPPTRVTITSIGEKGGRTVYGNNRERWGYADQYTTRT